METTTIKIHKTTKFILDEFRNENESYDKAIIKIIEKIKNKNLTKNLIEAYKNMGKKDLEILNEWETASKEL